MRQKSEGNITVCPLLTVKLAGSQLVLSHLVNIIYHPSLTETVLPAESAKASCSRGWVGHKGGADMKGRSQQQVPSRCCSYKRSVVIHYGQC